MPQVPITRILGHTQELLKEAQAILASPIRCPETDNLGIMAILFAAKELGHFEAIHALVDTGKYSDATIIARVMLEGMAVLVWASQDPDDRPRKWRAYSLVFDLRLMRDQQRSGTQVAPEQETNLLARLRSDAAMFLKAGRSDVGNPDAYRSRWHIDRSGRSPKIAEIVAGLDDPNLLPLYDALSNWIHWNARGLGAGVHREGELVRIKWDDTQEGAWALTSGFQALSLTMRALDQHFALGKSGRLLDIRERYVRSLLGDQAV